MSLSKNLRTYVSGTIRTRGENYFQQGAVTLDAIHRRQVYATVEGSEDYEVDLRLKGHKVHAFCNCPYMEDHADACKHIWATILAAEPQGFASNITPLRLVIDRGVYDDDDDYESSPPPKPELWKEQLAVLRNAVNTTSNSGSRSYTPATDRQLVYIIEVNACETANKIIIEINTQDRKKNGDWGKPQARQVPRSDAERLSDPLDRELHSLLSGAERHDNSSYYSYSYGVAKYHLTGMMLDSILPRLAQTNRVYLRKAYNTPIDTESLTFELDPPWEFMVGVTNSNSGKHWVLGGHLRRGNQTMALKVPTLIVPGVVVWDNRLARFDDAGAITWVKSLRNFGSIEVPADKRDELLGEILQMPQFPRLEFPEEFGYREETIAPQPRLVITPATRSSGPTILYAELSFDYDGINVPLNPPRRGVFQAEGRRYILRDEDAERAAVQELARLGMQPSTAATPKFDFKATQLPGLVQELMPAGWKIEADGKLYRPAGIFEMSLRSENDWFELNGSADFDGQRAPFPRLLEALQRGDSTIVLDDGSIGVLPENWLKKHGLIAQMGTVEGDSIRFSKAQVGVLDALLASRPEITFDKQFARARNELKKFEGITSAKPPTGFQGTLREYQRDGLGWLRFLRKFGFGGCLADEMGLGKTVQVLALLAGKRDGPALVVVPRSLIFNWKSEAEKFAPKLNVLDHTGTTRDRVSPNFHDYDIVLTTYGTLRNDAELFANVRFDSCVLDESQAAKNITTETAKAVRVVQADHRLALSGTPVENHLGELWTLFDFLNPGMLGQAMLTSGMAGSIRNPDAETRELLAKALRPFILRRTKDEVAKDLPAKTEQTIYCDMEPAQRKLYDELRDHYRQALLARVDSVGLNRSKIQVLEALLRLRQAACHPGLIDKKRVAEKSAKLEYLLPQLTELAESGHKVLVFSQFTSLLSIVKTRLDKLKMPYEYLDGKTRDRQSRVERFQTDPDCKLFLVSLKAGGVGLNLTAAEYVYLLDPWWNPAVEAQAIDRTHRIGQTKSVFAYRLIARNTVEEKVLALQQSKRELADAILGGDGRLITDLKREDLELLLS